MRYLVCNKLFSHFAGTAGDVRHAAAIAAVAVVGTDGDCGIPRDSAGGQGEGAAEVEHAASNEF